LTTRRRERGSIVLTSNRGFGDWNGVFPDRVVVSAIGERLMHKRPALNIGRQQLDARLLSPCRRQEKVVLSAELSSLRGRLWALSAVTHIRSQVATSNPRTNGPCWSGGAVHDNGRLIIDGHGVPLLMGAT